MALFLQFESWVTVGIVLLILRVVYFYYTKTPLPDLPWSGTTNRPFSKTLARIRCVFDHRACLNNAYETYSKKGQACILPNLVGDKVLLPSDGIDWLTNQPDELMDALEPQRDSLQADYTMGPIQLSQNPLHLHLVRRDLTRHVGTVINELLEEIELTFDELWGLDTEEWKEVPVVEDVKKLISRVSSRIFIGLPLCRDQAYLENTIKYADAIPLSSLFIKLVPRALRPVLARVIAAPNNYYLWKTSQWIKPMVKERVEAIERKERDPEYKYDEPKDLLQWAIKYARETESQFPGECSPKMLAGRLLVVNFASIHTSTFTVANALLDLVSAPKQATYIEESREEITRVLAEHNGIWSRPAIAKLFKIDSIIRESMRFSGILSHGLVRKVAPPEGIMFRGTKLPKDTIVAVPASDIHHDTDLFSGDAKYDAFRFATERQDLADSTPSPPPSQPTPTEKPANGDQKPSTSNNKFLEGKNLSIVSTSRQHLVFGHGRHSCPGRFFAANEMKLIFTYILQNYEIEPLEERPANVWVHDVAIPPKVNLRVRRRKGTVK